MPRQNRVTPLSTLIATPARGTFMGNRGCLHDGTGRIVRPWRGRLWISCLTCFKGRRRPLMTPGHYTELFFLDEAVALAAGHRPCAECRRAAYRAFRTAWDRAGLPPCDRASDIDCHLHAARLTGRTQTRQTLPADSLPDGAFVLDPDDRALLVVGTKCRPYAPDGYGPPLPRPTGPVVTLTPAPILAVLRAGYRALLHPSALTSNAPPMSQPDAPDAPARAFLRVEAP
jgi:hypothetical protein